MKEIKIEKCPYCGGEEFSETRVDAAFGVYLKKGLHEVPLFATVCRDCGSVVRTYCKKTENLFPKNKK